MQCTHNRCKLYICESRMQFCQCNNKTARHVKTSVPPPDTSRPLFYCPTRQGRCPIVRHFKTAVPLSDMSRPLSNCPTCEDRCPTVRHVKTDIPLSDMRRPLSYLIFAITAATRVRTGQLCKLVPQQIAVSRGTERCGSPQAAVSRGTEVCGSPQAHS